MTAFQSQYRDFVEIIENRLEPALLAGSYSEKDRVYQAARYSLLAGGKRIRPVLLLAVAKIFEADMNTAERFACAVEMIHTYSLIHDDLPCMDDDDFRRGRPTCHKAFGEATAILAGDALLNRAFELILDGVSIDLPGSLPAARVLAASAGLRGMIAGQSMDLDAEGTAIGLEELKNLHRHKTGALIKAPILAAALLAGADGGILIDLEGFSDAIGLAFQIQDDILDVTADAEILGKSTGKDARDLKSTYVSLLGLENARERLSSQDQEARRMLRRLTDRGLDMRFLDGLTDFLLLRKY